MNAYTAAIVVALSGVALLVFGIASTGDGPTVFGVVAGAGFVGAGALAAWDVAATRPRQHRLSDRELDRITSREDGL